MMTASLAPIELAPGMILGDEVYARIGAAILDGTFPSGFRLRDVELAQQLGVSRTPVREALQRLERFGLVEIAVGRYTRVSVPDVALRRDTAEFTLFLMGNALHLALSRCDDEQLAHLLRQTDVVLDAVSDRDGLRVFEATARLFVDVTLATDNAVFIGVVREGSLAIRRNLRSWPPFFVTSAQSGEAWERMRACIATRDGDGAEQVLRDLLAMT